MFPSAQKDFALRRNLRSCGKPGALMRNEEERIAETRGDTVTRQRFANSVLSVVLQNVISRQTRASRRTKSQVEGLTTANHRKDETLAIVSHELRSPLAAIKNALSLLASRAADTSVRDRAHAMIERQVRRMTLLVDDLLDASRIAQNRLVLRCERIDLRVVVSHAMETLEPEISHKKQRLVTSMPQAPVWSQADPCRLEQVFVNLIANASRYSDAGGDLTVWMHTRAGQAVIRVRDTGIGIAPEFLPHVFDLFEQGNTADPRCAQGLGIGLAVVRDLVELHGGSVTAASAGLGQGSEFAVLLRTEA
jgi:signal transduction histidine kinase